MQKQKSFYKSTKFIALGIALITLFAAGCTDSNNADLSRPKQTEKENSNPVADTLNNLDQQINPTEENGEVAGTEITELPKKNIKVKDTEVQVEIAENDAARTQGLSDREKLDDGSGMLFDFTNTNFRKPGFWMKDMLISIDMIWINQGKIISITPSAPIPPENEDLKVYYPPSEITHVLEVPAGWSAKNNLVVGDSVQL